MVYCLRVAVNNYRTRRDDLELLIRETVRLGNQLVSTARRADDLANPLLNPVAGCLDEQCGDACWRNPARAL
jgi:hypothetical protein